MIEGWITQLRKGLLEYCVLLVLRRGESYGYEIVQQLKEMEDLSVSESTIYPILGRLRDEKYLKVRDVASSSGPPRRYFSLTSRGKIRLSEMNAYWSLLIGTIETIKSHSRKDPAHEK
jgi:PadR family transcriptional regulator, regulatory protein PadR